MRIQNLGFRNQKYQIFSITTIRRPPKKLERRKKKWNLGKKDKKNKDKDAILATGDNEINTVCGQKKKKQATADTSNITYYNYEKKGYYVNKCPETLKNWCKS